MWICGYLFGCSQFTQPPFIYFSLQQVCSKSGAEKCRYAKKLQDQIFQVKMMMKMMLWKLWRINRYKLLLLRAFKWYGIRRNATQHKMPI